MKQTNTISNENKPPSKLSPWEEKIPWNVFGTSLLQKWSTDFDPAQRSLLPVWVEFPSLPLVFFPHIEKIAAMSGRVLCSEIPNGFVARPTRCVELSSSQDLPDFIELKAKGAVISAVRFISNPT